MTICLQRVISLQLTLPAKTLACLELFDDKIIVEEQHAIGPDYSRCMYRGAVQPAADGGSRNGQCCRNLLLAVQELLLLVFGHIVTQRGLLNRAAYEVEQLLASHVDDALVEEMLDAYVAVIQFHGGKGTKTSKLTYFYRTSRG